MASFRLNSPDGSIVAEGVRLEVPRGTANSLAERVDEFFAVREGGPDLIVGALPFDREAEDFLFQPNSAGTRTTRVPKGERTAGASGAQWIVTSEPSPEAYAESVAKALDEIALPRAADPLRKVVLSRCLDILADAPLDAETLLHRLSVDESVTAFSTLLPEEEGERPRLVGATPELLVSREGASVVSRPLAGSARRHGDPAADRRAALALEASDKDRREHNAVVEAILDTLSPYCRELGAPEGTGLRATATMWHLGTRILGTLRDPGTPVAELAAALHPTPAVCGLPRDGAMALIGELEGYDRGFYAGAVGWADSSGDGKWYVALRCARLAGRRARLYAGAGIVAGSDPLGEVDETSGKFLALLDALGVDEQGRPLKERAA